MPSSQDVELLPLSLPNADFIWAGKHPWIALQKLMLMKEEGRLNVSNLGGYRLSCLLRYVLDRLRESNNFSNWDHTRFSNFPDKVKRSVLLRDTIMTWKEMKQIMVSPSSFTNICPYGDTQSHLMGIASSKIKNTYSKTPHTPWILNT